MRNNSQSAMFCWNQGIIVCCTCGHLLRESESSRHLDPKLCDQEVRLYGKSSWKIEANKEHFIAHNLSETLKNPDLHLRIDRMEAECIQMDEVTQKDSSSGECERCENTWFISQHIWTKCTDETPIRFQRSIDKDAPSSPESGEERTCTGSFLPVSEMAFVFFFQCFMVAVE